MKFLPIILLICFTCLQIGCGQRKQENASGRIVTQVDIYCTKTSGTSSRHYTDTGKIEAVLHCIRLWDPVSPVNLPQVPPEDLYEIVVHLQNGTHRIYRQRDDIYAARHQMAWGQIDRSSGLRLPFLMALLPSDEVDAKDTDIA